MDRASFFFRYAVRPDTTRPTSPVCKMAFRRVCGACRHFDGELRQAGPGPCRLGFRQVEPRGAAAAQDDASKIRLQH